MSGSDEGTPAEEKSGVEGSGGAGAGGSLGGAAPLSTRPTSPLRRYGPLAAIAVVLALGVAATVVLGGGGDDDAADTSDVAVGEFPDGVITWSMAEEQQLDVEFGESCDAERGTIAIPFLFAAECVAVEEEALDPAYSEDDVQGVTEDEITVVAWLPDTSSDPAVQLFQQGLGSDATTDDWRTTYEGLVEVFEETYETYGRTINLEFVEASGSTLDGTIARADAREALAKEPFAIFGGPLTAVEWTEEIEAAGVICVACPTTRDFSPTSVAMIPEWWQVNQHVTSYVTTKLDGELAQHAGDEDLAGSERVFGILRLASSPDVRRDHEELEAMLDEAGVEVAESVVYDLDDLGQAQELGTQTIARFKDAGVTSVLAFADPIMFPSFTTEATAQDYYPEWILSAQPLPDMNAFARDMDQEQWAHAFGISSLPPATPPELNPGNQLYDWYHGELPPAAESILLIYPQVALGFTALQYAGPDLSQETALQGGYAFPPTPRSVTQPSLYYGLDGPAAPHREDPDRPDHGGVDDMVELWWDPDAVVVDEGGREAEGAYRYENEGQRYYWDEYPEEVTAFEEEGTILAITEEVIPADELPPDYPSPSDG